MQKHFSRVLLEGCCEGNHMTTYSTLFCAYKTKDETVRSNMSIKYLYAWTNKNKRVC